MVNLVACSDRCFWAAWPDEGSPAAVPPSSSLLRGRRQRTDRAEIHCGFGVVVSPSTGSDQAGPSTRTLASRENFRGLRQLRVVHFRESVGAEIERGLQPGDEFVFRVGLFQF